MKAKKNNKKFESILYYIIALKYSKNQIKNFELFEYEINKNSFYNNFKELRRLFRDSKEKLWNEYGLFFRVDKEEHNNNLSQINHIQSKLNSKFGYGDSVRETFFEIESLLNEAERNLYFNNQTSFISTFILISENILEGFILSNYIKKDIIEKYFKHSSKSLNSYKYSNKINLMNEHLNSTAMRYEYKPYLKILLYYSECFDMIRNHFIMHPYFLDRYKKITIPKTLFLGKLNAIKSKLNLIEEILERFKLDEWSKGKPITYINSETGKEIIRVQKNYSHSFAENLNKQRKLINLLIKKTEKHKEFNYLHRNYSLLFNFFVEFSISYLQFIDSTGHKFDRDKFISYGGSNTVCLRFDIDLYR
jgi:hypothetical protein